MEQQKQGKSKKT